MALANARLPAHQVLGSIGPLGLAFELELARGIFEASLIDGHGCNHVGTAFPRFNQ